MLADYQQEQPAGTSAASHGSDGQSLANDGSAPSVAEADSLGEEPADNPLEFLRQQAVILRPGQWQVDVGLIYSISEKEFPIVIGPSIAHVQARRRVLAAPVGVRYGLTSRHQLFASVPIGWANAELSTVDLDEFSNVAGIGDVRAGVNMLLLSGCPGCPDLIGTFAFTAPTGEEALPILSGFNPDAALGDGFWAIDASLLWIQTMDPVVLFYGLGARYRFEDDRAGGTLSINPGEEYFYQFGVGFAVNPRVTFSTSFIGSYITEDSINGDRVEGTIREPMRLRFATTIFQGRRVVEPFAEVGLTEDAPSASTGIIWTY